MLSSAAIATGSVFIPASSIKWKYKNYSCQSMVQITLK